MAINFLEFKDYKTSIKNDQVQIFNFYAEWCGPCKMLAPVLDEISSEIEVYKINIDYEKEAIRNDGVQNIPFTRIYKNGNIVKEISGYVPKEKILEFTK